MSPAIAVTKNCPATPVLEGASLVFTGTVMNTGNVTLTDIFVYNTRPAANTRVLGPITLAPGATTNFTGSYTAPLNLCSIADTLTAIGRDKCQNVSVTNTTTTTCPIVTVPRIAVTLACPTGPSTPGAPVTYTGSVRNAGNVTLNNVTVVNAQASPSTVLSLPSLAPGASAGFNATITAPSDTCSVSSTVVAATGTDACSAVEATATASATCPLVTSPKLVVSQECPPNPASLGGFLVYTGTLRNTGNITLTNVTVTDDREDLSDFPSSRWPAARSTGAVAPFTGSFSVPPDSACSITSTLTGTGFDPCTGARIAATSSATCPWPPSRPSWSPRPVLPRPSNRGRSSATPEPSGTPAISP